MYNNYNRTNNYNQVQYNRDNNRDTNRDTFYKDDSVI